MNGRKVHSAPMTRLTAHIAAEIAHRHGLTLSDALALRGLTTDPEEADELAAMFSADNAEEPA